MIKTTEWFKSGNLTCREVQVFDLVLLGHGSKRIAIDLSCAERTVKAHLASIFKKLNVVDRNYLFATVIQLLTCNCGVSSVG